MCFSLDRLVGVVAWVVGTLVFHVIIGVSLIFGVIIQMFFGKQQLL